MAFKVNNIDEAITGKKVILGHYFPFAGYRVAMIEVAGAPVELIETTLTLVTLQSLKNESRTILSPSIYVARSQSFR